MSSVKAKVRFVADSTNWSFWGSNPEEQHQIDQIRSEFAPYLFDPEPPIEILNKLGPIAEKLILDTKNMEDHLVCMYE